MSAFRLTCGKSKCTALTFRRCASIDASAASAAATASAAAWLSPLSASVARRTAVTEALLSDRPRIHQSFLYDARGVALYEGILGTPEYYLPAAEEALLQANLDALTAPLSSRLALVELGAGDGGRTRRLVERAAAQAAGRRNMRRIQTAGHCLHTHSRVHGRVKEAWPLVVFN